MESDQKFHIVNGEGQVVDGVSLDLYWRLWNRLIPLEVIIAESLSMGAKAAREMKESLEAMRGTDRRECDRLHREHCIRYLSWIMMSDARMRWACLGCGRKFRDREEAARHEDWSGSGHTVEAYSPKGRPWEEARDLIVFPGMMLRIHGRKKFKRMCRRHKIKPPEEITPESYNLGYLEIRPWPPEAEPPQVEGGPGVYPKISPVLQPPMGLFIGKKGELT